MLEDTIHQYEEEIKEKDKQIEKLSKEKFKFSKISHEFHNRQKALELKVKEIVRNAQIKNEIGEELGVIDRINVLSQEYSNSML